jgi:hypothetical protein
MTNGACVPATDIDAGATLLLVVLLSAAGIGGSFALRRQRRRSPGSELVSAETPTDDLHYPYYLAREDVRVLAQTFKIVLPDMRETTRKRGVRIGSASRGSIERGRESTTTTPEQINLPALARLLRTRIGPEHLSVDVGHVPEAYVSDAPLEAAARENLIADKRRSLQAVADGNKLVVIRGYIQQSRRGPEEGQQFSGMALELTHLSSEKLGSKEPSGNPAELVMPQGVAVVIALPAATSCTDAGHERFKRDQAFFGEVIAHSPSFDESTGVFTCAAYAVWGCIKPQTADMAFAF